MPCSRRQVLAPAFGNLGQFGLLFGFVWEMSGRLGRACSKLVVASAEAGFLPKSKSALGAVLVHQRPEQSSETALGRIIARLATPLDVSLAAGFVSPVSAELASDAPLTYFLRPRKCSGGNMSRCNERSGSPRPLFIQKRLLPKVFCPPIRLGGPGLLFHEKAGHH